MASDPAGIRFAVRPQALMEFNPITAYYWQGRALFALGDVRGARKAYRRVVLSSTRGGEAGCAGFVKFCC
ncbi:MAG: hypothetical protein GDA44_00600 [Prochloron sp. SP5CPC1]|nr:hypothetical protein [Candidatus Paraprochloron terpiosi SP5CPC1]